MTDPKTMTSLERDVRKQQIDGEIAALKLERAQLGRSASEEFERDFEIGSCCRYRERNEGLPFTYAMVVDDDYEDDGLRVPTYIAFMGGTEGKKVSIERFSGYIQYRMIADFERITRDEFEKGKAAVLALVGPLSQTKPEAP